MKRNHVLSVGKDSFSTPELVPPSLGNHMVFLGSLISSQSSKIGGILSEDEDESYFICGSPIQKWID